MRGVSIIHEDTFYGSKRDFRVPFNTELFKYIWQLKNLTITAKISCRIAVVIICAARIDCCKLCLTEKLLIIKSFDNNQLLNEKSELVNTCIHRNKFLLKSLERNRSRNDTME